MKKMLKKHQVIIFFGILLLLKGVAYYSEDIVQFFKLSRYKYYTESFTKIKPTEAIQDINDGEEKILIYFGRDTCPYCVKLIKNIKNVSDIALREEIPFYYIDKKENLTKEDVSLIDEVFDIKYIPCIISVEKNTIKIFDYEKLKSNDYENEFKKFIKS